jgi:hypothetical protein
MAMLIAGILCSFSGAYLSIVQSGFFLRDMSAGAGYWRRPWCSVTGVRCTPSSAA